MATGDNNLYAFDATNPAASQPFWRVTQSVFGKPVPKEKVTDLPPDQEYLNFDSQIGIVATPVIDDKTGTIYVVANSVNGGQNRFRLHAFDLTTGREKTAPTEIQASYVGNGIGNEDGRLRFQARKMLNRPAILLLDGVLYLAFTAHLDGEPSFDSHGWIITYDARTLQQLSAFCTTPDGIQGGIWQTASRQSVGLARIPSSTRWRRMAAWAGGTSARAFCNFCPVACSASKMSSPPPTTPTRTITISTCPPGRSFCPASLWSWHAVRTASATWWTVPICGWLNSYGRDRPSNIHGTPVAWRDEGGHLRIYLWGEEDFLRAFQFGGQHFEPAGKSTMRAPEKSMPGGFLTLSSNGSVKDTAIVWASLPLEGDANAATVHGVVRAFDAANVEKELWNSQQNSARDGAGMFAKFCPPVVANGKVYVATFAPPAKNRAPGAHNRLVVYGSLEPPRPATTGGLAQ